LYIQAISISSAICFCFFFVFYICISTQNKIFNEHTIVNKIKRQIYKNIRLTLNMDDIIINADSRSTTYGIKTGLIHFSSPHCSNIHFCVVKQWRHTTVDITLCIIKFYVQTCNLRCFTNLFSISTVNKIQIAIVFNRMSTVS